MCHFEHVIRTNTFLAEYQTHTSGLSFQLSEMKPSPAFFKKCLQKAGLRAEQIFFLDDSAENVMAARRLGIDAHQVRGIEEALNALYERDVILMPKVRPIYRLVHPLFIKKQKGFMVGEINLFLQAAIVR